MALQQAGEQRLLPSVRKILVAIRVAIRNVVGAYLGPRQRQSYWQRLQAARGTAAVVATKCVVPGRAESPITRPAPRQSSRWEETLNV
jgi:hypothetical protein